MAYETLPSLEPVLGPLKVYGQSKPGQTNGDLTGWFYPLYLTRKEAILADIEKGGKGIYQVITFHYKEGEFYVPDSFGSYGKNKQPLVYTLYEGAGAENPFAKIQNKLSLLVETQLPEFVQTDYGMFITFIKAYYEFLEQTNEAQELLQNISKYADVDQTSSFLIDKFFENYAYDITKSSVSDNTFLIKKIRDIYSRKGTEDAYKILFNILYKETIEFFYPYEIVLKTSSGKWYLPKSLKVKQIDPLQNIFDFENTLIIGNTSGATAVVNKVQKIILGGYEIYELLLDPNSITNYFYPNEKITASKSVLLNDVVDASNLIATTYSVLSKIDVVDGKLGYVVGAPITTIYDPSGNGLFASAKVSGVNQYGAITSIEIDNSGIAYGSNTTVDIGLPTGNLQGTYSIVNGVVTIEFYNIHNIKKNTKLSISYTGNTLSPVNNTSHNVVVTSVPNVRSIRFTYPGI
jgi:hypothetical protein